MPQKKKYKMKSISSQAKNAGKKGTAKKPDGRRPFRREIGALVCLGLAVLSALGCFGMKSFFTDLIVDLSKGLVGGGYVILPFCFLLGFIILMFHDGRPVRLRVTCTFLLAVTIGTMVHTVAGKDPAWSFYPMLKSLYLGGVRGSTGGLIAGLLSMGLSALVTKIGAMIFLIIGLALELLTCLNMTVPGVIKAIRQRPRLEYDKPKKEHADPAKVIVDKVAQHHIDKVERKRVRASEYNISIDDTAAAKSVTAEKTRKKITSPDEFLVEEQRELDGFKEKESGIVVPQEPVEVSPEVQAVLDEQPQKLKKEEIHQETVSVAQEIEESVQEEIPQYIYPPIDLLRGGDGRRVDGTEEMRINSARLNDTLSSFGIDAHIVNVVRGPSVTRYELELDRGVKLSKITGLADDIALSLGASGVRISAIPDKISVVGIEVPH